MNKSKKYASKTGEFSYWTLRSLRFSRWLSEKDRSAVCKFRMNIRRSMLYKQWPPTNGVRYYDWSYYPRHSWLLSPNWVRETLHVDYLWRSNIIIHFALVVQNREVLEARCRKTKSETQIRKVYKVKILTKESQPVSKGVPDHDGWYQSWVRWWMRGKNTGQAKYYFWWAQVLRLPRPASEFALELPPFSIIMPLWSPPEANPDDWWWICMGTTLLALLPASQARLVLEIGWAAALLIPFCTAAKAYPRSPSLNSSSLLGWWAINEGGWFSPTFMLRTACCAI